VREYNPETGRKVERVYTVLNVLEFNSARKRMSVIVRNEEGKLLLLSKGADRFVINYLDTLHTGKFLIF
jgi:phospholipid-translocating ATPase